MDALTSTGKHHNYLVIDFCTVVNFNKNKMKKKFPSISYVHLCRLSFLFIFQLYIYLFFFNCSGYFIQFNFTPVVVISLKSLFISSRLKKWKLKILSWKLKRRYVINPKYVNLKYTTNFISVQIVSKWISAAWLM